jgi:hypothetical protein
LPNASRPPQALSTLAGWRPGFLWRWKSDRSELSWLDKSAKVARKERDSCAQVMEQVARELAQTRENVDFGVAIAERGPAEVICENQQARGQLKADSHHTNWGMNKSS